MWQSTGWNPNDQEAAYQTSIRGKEGAGRGNREKGKTHHKGRKIVHSLTQGEIGENKNYHRKKSEQLGGAVVRSKEKRDIRELHRECTSPHLSSCKKNTQAGHLLARGGKKCRLSEQLDRRGGKGFQKRGSQKRNATSRNGRVKGKEKRGCGYTVVGTEEGMNQIAKTAPGGK